ncbi:MAG: hypothetical protein RLZZ574_2567 [Cyanobacteriota bacterium]
MVYLPGSIQYKNYLYKEITKRLDSPLIYKMQQETYWGNDTSRNMHRTVADLPLGLDVIESWFDNLAQIGMADEYDLYSDDIKLVELEGLGFGKFYCTAFARAINWTWGEIEKYRTAQTQGTLIESFNPIDAKLGRLGSYFNKREHYTVLYGYPKRRLYGIFSQQGCSTQDTTFKPLAATGQLTVRQLCFDIRDYVFFFMDRAGLSSPNQVTIGIDPFLFARLSEPYVDPQGSEKGSGFAYLASINITSFEVYNELRGDNLTKYVINDAGNAMYDSAFNRIVFKAPYTPERHIFPRKVFEPFQVKTMKYEQVGISASTGIIFREPNKIWYLDYSNTTA